MKKKQYLTNTTDEMLVNWAKSSALRKMQWLQDIFEFYNKANSKKVRKAYIEGVRK